MKRHTDDGLQREILSRDKMYPIAADQRATPTGARAQWTGETRPPQAGEWFLSGATIEAYFAAYDLATVYPIAKLYRPATEIVRWEEI